jgi:hypothetical protein
MKNLLAPIALVAAMSSTASAAIFELSASLRLGAATGSGLGGAQQENDFFEGTKGTTWGGLVGLEVFFIQLYVEHDQFTDFSDVRGTWTQIMVGPRLGFPLNEVLGAITGMHADMGLAVGYGFGTGQQIVPPIDDGEISDKGLMLELKVGLEYRFNRFVGVGVSFPVAWGYLVKNDIPITETDGHYHSFHAMALGTITVRAGF